MEMKSAVLSRLPSYTFSLLLIGSYIFVYQATPFSVFWNNLLRNLIIILAACFAAVSGMAVWRIYHREDRPYAVWRSFTLGFVAWALAEITWSSLNLIGQEVPVPRLADVFWYLGYVFFTYGFIRQYRITYQTSKKIEWLGAGLIWTLVGVVLVFVAFSNNKADNLFVNLFDVAYPFADTAILLFALGLAWSFRGGVLARPWLAMVIFAVSDGIYAWLIQSGAYAWSLEQGTPLSLAVDVLYLIAYLAVGLGFLSQYYLLKRIPKIQIQPNVYV